MPTPSPRPPVTHGAGAGNGHSCSVSVLSPLSVQPNVPPTSSQGGNPTAPPAPGHLRALSWSCSHPLSGWRILED